MTFCQLKNLSQWSNQAISHACLISEREKPLISFPKLSGVFMPYGLLSCLWPRGPDRECRAKIQRKSFRPTTPSYKQPQSNIVEHIKPRPKKPSRLKDLASKDIFLRCLHEQHQLISSFYLSPSNHIQLQFKHNSSETNFILSFNCNLWNVDDVR